MSDILLSAIHVRAAKPVLNKIVIIMGILSGLAIVGGIIGIVWNAVSPTKFKILGAELSTGHVGVSFAALGLISMLFVARSVLKYTHKLASLPND